MADENTFTDVGNTLEQRTVPFPNTFTDQYMQQSGNVQYLPADLGAVVKTAPDLATGKQLLNEAYSSYSWDDPTQAKDYYNQFSNLLDLRFKSDPNQVPVPIDTIKGEGDDEQSKQIDVINKWEAANTEALAKSPDPNSEGLNKYVEDYAHQTRQKINEQFDSGLTQGYARAGAGLFGGMLNLVGADSTLKALEEHIPHTSNDDDFGTTIWHGLEGAAGSIAGIEESATVGAGAGGVIGGPVGAAAGAAIGVGSYLAATAVGQVRKAFKDSYDETGSVGTASKSAGLEALGQTVLLGLGGFKTIAQPFMKTAAQVASKEAPSIIKEALKMGVIQAVGNAASNEARIVGEPFATDQQAKDTGKPVSAWEGTTASLAIGALLGGGTGAYETFSIAKGVKGETDSQTNNEAQTRNVIGGVVDAEKTAQVSSDARRTGTPLQDVPAPEQALANVKADFTTESGDKYQVTEDGTTRRYKAKTGEVFQPMDKTFYVDKNTADTLGVLRNTLDNEGGNFPLTTDGTDLYVESEQFGRFKVNTTERGTGNYVVDVNTAKTVTDEASTESNSPVKEYRSHISGTPIKEVPLEYQTHLQTKADTQASTIGDSDFEGSVGAAKASGVYRESRTADVRRNDPNSTERLRDLFKAVTQPEKTFTHSDLSKQIRDAVDSDLSGVTNEFMNLEQKPDRYVDNALGEHLYVKYRDLAKDALTNGDEVNAAHYEELAFRVGLKADSLNSETGRALNAVKQRFLEDPELAVFRIKKGLRESANEQFAKDEGISRKDVDSLESELTRVKKELADLKKVNDETLADRETKTPGSRKLAKNPDEAGLDEPQKKRKQTLDSEQQKIEDRLKRQRQAVEKKLSALDSDTQKQMRTLLDQAKNTGGSAQQLVLQAFRNLERKVVTKDIHWSRRPDFWWNYWVANQFGGPSTYATVGYGGIFSHLTSTLGKIASGAVQGKFDAGSFLKGAIDSAVGGKAYQAAVSEIKGFKTSKLGQEFLGETDLYKQLGRGRGEAPENKLGMLLRPLRAAHSFVYTSLKDGEARFIARLIHDEGIRSGDKQRVELANRMFNAGERWGDALDSAKREAKVLEDVGHKVPESFVKYRAHEILESQWPQEVRMQAHTIAARDALIGEPRGVIGEVYQLVRQLADKQIQIPGTDIKVRPLKFSMLPVVKLPFDLLDIGIQNTPIGFARILDKNLFKETWEAASGKKVNILDTKTGEVSNRARKFSDVHVFDRNLPEAEFRNDLGRAIVGTTLITGALTLAYSEMTSKNPLFTIHGGGPDNPDERKRNYDAKIKPYSIQIGDHYLSYLHTPMSLVFGAIGTYLDKVRYDKEFDPKLGVETLGIMMMGAADSFMHHSFLDSMGKTLDAVMHRKDEKAVDTLVEAWAIQPLKGFIPALGVWRTLGTMIDNPTDTRGDYMAKVLQGLPLVQGFAGQPSLNIFGQPGSKNTEELFNFVSKFHSEKTTDPDIRWLVDNNYRVLYPHMTVVDTEKAKENRAKGDAAEAQGDATTAAKLFNVFTPSEASKVVKLAGPQVKQIVSQYRQQYGNSAYQESVQRQLTSDLSRVYSNVKKQLFVH